MTDREYETLVHRLVDELAQSTGSCADAQVNGGCQNKVIGASGFSHQIDVSLHAGSTVVLVESKLWLAPVDAEAVLTLAARLVDIRAANPTATVHASLVSTKGVTRGAEQLARYFGVSLDVVANEREYAIRLSNQVFVTVVERLNVTDHSDAEVVPYKVQDESASR
jgi:hypothetical protein